MSLVLDIEISAAFWRKVFPIHRAPKAAECNPPSQCACSWNEIESQIPLWVTLDLLEPFDGRIHVMSFDESSRRQSARHVVHAWSGFIPEGSFYEMQGAYIASPPFMFLAAATVLSLPELIAFGCELCGLYSFDESRERGFRTRKVPLLTIEQLACYIKSAKGCRGVKNAQMALKYVIPNSASPMETFDAMLLYLPYRLGGYGLPRPKMNYRVRLSGKAARIAKRQTCYADMCYPEIKLDLEHQGEFDHSTPEEVASDRARVNALKEMGYEVIEFTKDQVNDLLTFEYIALRVAKLLGKRIRKEGLGATKPRMSLRRAVREWNRSGGRLRRG